MDVMKEQAASPLSAASLEGIGKAERDDLLFDRLFDLFSATHAAPDRVVCKIVGTVLEMDDAALLRLMQPARRCCERHAVALLKKVRELEMLDEAWQRYSQKFPLPTSPEVTPSPGRGKKESARASDTVKEKPARDAVKEEPAPSRRSRRSAKAAQRAKETAAEKQVTPLTPPAAGARGPPSLAHENVHRLQVLRLQEDAAKAERARRVEPAAKMQATNLRFAISPQEAKLLVVIAAEEGVRARAKNVKAEYRRREAEAEAAATRRPCSPSELRGRTHRASPRGRTRRGMANAAHANLSQTGRAELRRHRARRARQGRRGGSVAEAQVEAVRANPNILALGGL